MKKLLTFFLCMMASLLYSQKYDYVWMAGAYIPDDTLSGNFTLDFSTFPPIAERVADSLEMNIASVAISDNEGALQFYTNGCIIRTKNSTTMENGGFINQGPGNTTWNSNCGPLGLGHYPVNQGLFALPLENGIQEIFHIKFEFIPPAPSAACTNTALLYTKIDMNANQGLGKVVFKDSVLVQSCLQTACANRHANGRDWWVLLAENLNNRFYRFLSTPDGLEGPWIQEIENPTIDTFYYGGWNEFSPNGEHLLINDIHSGTAVYDFDRCTGLLSNLRYIPPAVPDMYLYGYAAAFSPNSRLIYVVKDTFNTIEQFDLQAADLAASRTEIARWDGYFDYFEPNGPFIKTFFGYFEHGPDGKLYNWTGSRFMHIMEFPDRKGTDCKLRQRAIKLPYYSFANSSYYPNYRLGPIDESSCDTLGINNLPSALFRYDIEDTLSPLQVTFTDVSSYLPTSWHWDFGDGAMSQDINPVHTYSMPGNYNVCLIVSNVYAADTFCREVVVGTSGIHELPALPHARISPNPFSDEVQIQLPALVGVHPRFVLFDLYGRNVANVSLQDFETRLSLPGLPSGVYFWELSWKGVRTQSGKLVKAR